MYGGVLLKSLYVLQLGSIFCNTVEYPFQTLFPFGKSGAKNAFEFCVLFFVFLHFLDKPMCWTDSSHRHLVSIKEHDRVQAKSSLKLIVCTILRLRHFPCRALFLLPTWHRYIAAEVCHYATMPTFTFRVAFPPAHNEFQLHWTSFSCHHHRISILLCRETV